jgi:hypothetical protein
VVSCDSSVGFTTTRHLKHTPHLTMIAMSNSHFLTIWYIYVEANFLEVLGFDRVNLVKGVEILSLRPEESFCL